MNSRLKRKKKMGLYLFFKTQRLFRNANLALARKSHGSVLSVSCKRQKMSRLAVWATCGRHKSPLVAWATLDRALAAAKRAKE
jgi:hypothetical protein